MDKRAWTPEQLQAVIQGLLDTAKPLIQAQIEERLRSILQDRRGWALNDAIERQIKRAIVCEISIAPKRKRKKR